MPWGLKAVYCSRNLFKFGNNHAGMAEAASRNINPPSLKASAPNVYVVKRGYFMGYRRKILE